MKVRRKSEIAEAVANAIIKAIPVAKHLEQPVKGILLETITEILAAHYEPVPELPAEVPCRCDVEMYGRHCDDCPNAWAEAKAKLESLRGEKV